MPAPSVASAARFTVATRPGPVGQLGSLVSAGRIIGGRGVPGAGARAIDTYAAMLVTRGHGVYRDQVGERSLGPGSLVTVAPQHRHWYGVVGPNRWNEVYLTFAGPAFDTARSAGTVNPDDPVHMVAPLPFWVDRFTGFRTRRPPTTSGGADREVCDLLRLLVDIVSGPEVASGRGDWLGRSQDWLARDLGEPLSPVEVAASVGMGYESWRKRFQVETGVSPARFRMLRRIDAAAEALRRSTLSHREIAASLGFSDEHHLSKTFRAVRGVAPSQFRRQHG